MSEAGGRPQVREEILGKSRSEMETGLKPRGGRVFARRIRRINGARPQDALYNPCMRILHTGGRWECAVAVGHLRAASTNQSIKY
jgi:hypothetical protein